MPYHVESAIIELETLTPLFIKGKDVDYGEGFLKVENTLYLVDNDKLCELIYQETFDEKGNKKSNIVEGYERYFVRSERFDNSSEFSNFCRTFNLNYKEKNDKGKYTIEFSLFKEMSLQFFLESVGLLKGNNQKKNEFAQRIAKGITYILDGNRFVQNGKGKNFIPGSSIKGAIRNAVLWKILSSQTKWLTDFVSYNISESKKSEEKKREYTQKFSKKCDKSNKNIDSMSFTKMTPKKTIMQDIDEDVKKYLESFNERWQSANETLRDFFRIVKISDANFDGEVRIENKIAKAVCKNEKQSYQKKFNINLQCVAENTKARFKISIDHQLAKEFFPSGVPDYLQSVSNLLKTVDDFFRDVANFEEKDFFEGLTSISKDENNAKLKVNTDKVYKIYKEKFGLTDNDVLFRTGWGGGFMSKTQFLHLAMNERVKIRDLVRYNGSQIAPKSRCLIVDGQDAIAPLGWCKLSILPSSGLPDINQANISIPKENKQSQGERRTQNHGNHGGYQSKPATEKEIAQSKAEANNIVKQAEKSKLKHIPYKKGDEIEMRVVESVPLKSITLEKDGNRILVETNKMKQVGESVKVKVLETAEGKITKVKLI